MQRYVTFKSKGMICVNSAVSLGELHDEWWAIFKVSGEVSLIRNNVFGRHN